MPLIRSLFFAPANRPDLVAKFPRFAADCYVIDLEDGTPPAHKASARAGIAQLVADLRKQARLPGVLTVRVNEPESDHYLDDLAAALASDVDGIVIPKLESVEQLFPALHRRRPGIDRRRRQRGGAVPRRSEPRRGLLRRRGPGERARRAAHRRLSRGAVRALARALARQGGAHRR